MKQKGFTLLEAMIAMVIVSVGLLAMAQMLLTTMKQNNSSEARLETSVLAKSALTEAATKIAGPGSCVALMPVQARNATNSARAGQTVDVACTDLGNGKYLLVATVTDKATGKVTKNQMLYTSVTAATVGSTTSTPGTGTPTPGTGGGTGGGAGGGTGGGTGGGAGGGAGTGGSGTTPPPVKPPVTGGGAGTGGSGTTPPPVKPPVTGGGSTWLDTTEVTSWLSDSKFQKGFDNKKKDVKKFNQCPALSAYAPVNNPPTSGDIANINNAIASLSAGGASLSNAKTKYNEAVKAWNKGDTQKAGEKIASMLKELAKAAGC